VLLGGDQHVWRGARAAALIDRRRQPFVHQLTAKRKSRREWSRRLNIWRLEMVQNIDLLQLSLVIVTIKVKIIVKQR
jgi:hypothetical protein